MARNPQREILAYLLKGGRLTVQKAWRMFSTTELRRIVSRLKQKGHPIVDEWKYSETNDGRRVKFKEYYMAQSEVKASAFTLIIRYLFGFLK